MNKVLQRFGLTAGLSFILFFSGLSAEEAETRREYNRGDLPKLISLVKTSTSPVIDGIMDEDEWDDAAVITGLSKVESIAQGGLAYLENIASHQSKFWITYDSDNLYIAHHSPPPPSIKDAPAMVEVMLKKEQTLRDACPHLDDSIHIAIIEPVDIYPGGDKYVIQINSIGTIFDCIWNTYSYNVWDKATYDLGLGNARGITLGWDVPLKTASHLTLEGWFIEVSMPWEGLGPHIKEPADGEIKHMNFARIWRGVMDEGHKWSVDDHLSPVGKVVFSGKEGVLVKLSDAGNLPRGDASFSADIKNMFSSRRRIAAEVTTDSGELHDRKELSLAPGEAVSYSFRDRVKDFATTTITFSVADAETGEVFHLTTLPVIRPTKPAFFIRRYRSRELSRIETDIAFIGAADLSRASITLTLSDKETGKRVFSRRYRGFTSYEPALEFSTEGLKPGDYHASFVFSAPGMSRYETSIDYRHPELPEWWDNRYGYEDMDSDIVPYPWTDMKVEDDTLMVWGRDYRFGNSLLPEQITSLGRNILRGPIRLLLETSDGKVIDTAAFDAEHKWTKTNRTRVEGSREINGAFMSVANSFWAEYDGLLWSTLKLTPRASTEITSMVLEIPLTSEFTDVMNNADYSLRTTGKLDEQGYWSSHTRGLWLGNGDGGIQFTSGQGNSFFVRDFRQVLNVEKDEAGATLRVIMVDMPSVFDKPYEVEFGLIATPVRPKLTRTPYFRVRSLSGAGGSGTWYPAGMELVPAADPGHDPYGYGSKAGRIYVHTDPLNVSPEALAKDAAGSEDFLFADEFRHNPQGRTLNRIDNSFHHKPARDYFVWRHWHFQNKYGYAGLYYDSPGGQSYLGLRDVMKRMYNITLSNQLFAAREANIGLHKSAMMDMVVSGFASYFWDAENYNSIINAQQPTYLGLTDPALYRAQHMGHNFGWPLYFLGQGRLTRERVEAAGGPEPVFDHIYGLNLLHDGNGVCCILPGITRQLQYRREQDVEKLNLSHWIYQFTPYWEQDIAELPGEEMYASFYIARPSVLTATRRDEWSSRMNTFRNYIKGFEHLPFYIQRTILQEDIEYQRKDLEKMGDRAVMVVYNDTGWEGEMRLKVDWKKIGLGEPGQLNALNYLHSTGFRVETEADAEGNQVEKGVFFERPEEYARIEGDELVFPMTRFNYRMIVLEKKQ